jgi:hypothetical protein
LRVTRLGRALLSHELKLFSIPELNLTGHGALLEARLNKTTASCSAGDREFREIGCRPYPLLVGSSRSLILRIG